MLVSMDQAEQRMRSLSQDKGGIQIDDLNETETQDLEFGKPLLDPQHPQKPPLNGNFSLQFIQKTLGYSRNKVNITVLESLGKSEFNLFHILHELVLVISDLTAGVLNIQRSIGYGYKHTFKDFREFLKILETYGCGYQDDIDVRNYKLREK